MERLTIRTPAGVANLDYPQNAYFQDGTKDQIATSAFRQRAIDRLAAYEETGLEPEEIPTGLELANAYAAMLLLKRYQALGPIEEMSALIKAREGGRVVVVPCKVGDTLYTESPIGGMVASFKAPDLAWIIENISEFGKNVFLTRAEAEEALQKGGPNEPDPV